VLTLAATLGRAAPARQFAPGAVVGLAGTPHVWVADEAGVLHWAGDTRALSSRPANWSTKLDLTIDQLRALRRGEPWLSAGLVKLGDAIYLAKWESEQVSPTLFHIRSIADVEFFGIDGTNYGQLVLEEAAWQERFGFAPRNLLMGVLQSAVATPTPTPTPGPTSTPVPTPTATPPAYSGRIVMQQRLGPCSWETVVEVSGLRPGQRMSVSSTHEVYNCGGGGPNRNVSTATGFAPHDAGAAGDNGVLRWRLEHSAFRSARYVFSDEAGHQVTVEQGSD
jgi:hypothetical protein